jgi:hypothetical protein
MDVDVVLLPLRDSGCKEKAGDESTRRGQPTWQGGGFRVIVRVVGEGALHVPFARKAWILSHPRAYEKKHPSLVFAQLF